MAKKTEKIDGLSADDIKKIRSAVRRVWAWSNPRRLAMARVIQQDGFSKCENCKKVAPKIFIDHIVAVGDLDGGFIERLFCPSSGLQALCKKCHNEKTKEERRQLKSKKS